MQLGKFQPRTFHVLALHDSIPSKYICSVRLRIAVDCIFCIWERNISKTEGGGGRGQGKYAFHYPRVFKPQIMNIDKFFYLCTQTLPYYALMEQVHECQGSLGENGAPHKSILPFEWINNHTKVPV